MFRSNLMTYPNSGANHAHSYGENLGMAARAFVAALLAVDPAANDASVTEEPVSDHVRLKGIDEMNRLAREFDSTMPNQASELRYLAGRDLPGHE